MQFYSHSHDVPIFLWPTTAFWNSGLALLAWALLLCTWGKTQGKNGKRPAFLQRTNELTAAWPPNGFHDRNCKQHRFPEPRGPPVATCSLMFTIVVFIPSSATSAFLCLKVCLISAQILSGYNYRLLKPPKALTCPHFLNCPPSKNWTQSKMWVDENHIGVPHDVQICYLLAQDQCDASSFIHFTHTHTQTQNSLALYKNLCRTICRPSVKCDPVSFYELP